MAQELAMRWLACKEVSLRHDMMMTRGVERLKDQILRRISVGRAGKRWKVVDVDIIIIAQDNARHVEWWRTENLDKVVRMLHCYDFAECELN